MKTATKHLSDIRFLFNLSRKSEKSIPLTEIPYMNISGYHYMSGLILFVNPPNTRGTVAPDDWSTHWFTFKEGERGQGCKSSTAVHLKTASLSSWASQM